MIPISQGHLTLLDACARKYQYIFFDALSGPATYDQQLTTQWGSQFHRLMQQRALNLPVEVLAEADTEMAASMAALAKAAPDVFTYLSAASDPPAERDPLSDDASATTPFSQSEHRRTLEFNGYLLTVVYDLLVRSPMQGQIFDWKTHQRLLPEDQLRNDWQTRLYLYVLCETTDLSPQQLSMTYWFVRGSADRQEAPRAYRFDYSEVLHRRTQQDLQRLTDRLSEMIRRVEFPKVPVEKGLCDRCLFNVRCDRVTTTLESRGDQVSEALASPPVDPQRLLSVASQLTADMVEEIPL
ncbi:MAG: PD-(D/E)XK nuclease family protein [Cyanobacteria bacterium J06634_5]